MITGGTDIPGRQRTSGQREMRRASPTPASVQTYVLTSVRAAIVDGTLRPGQHLVERELKQLYGASRSSIRESLRELTTEGLVTAIPNLGSVVASLTLEQVEQLYEVRAELEGLAGRLFVVRADPAHRAALSAALDAVEQMAAAEKPIINAHDAFHEALYLGGDSSPLHASALSMRSRVRYLLSLSLARPYHAERAVAGLRAVARAVDANDPDAAAQASARNMATECAAVLMMVALGPGVPAPVAGPVERRAVSAGSSTTGRTGRG